jgi:hypothetical protein
LAEVKKLAKMSLVDSHARVGLDQQSGNAARVSPVADVRAEVIVDPRKGFVAHVVLNGFELVRMVTSTVSPMWEGDHRESW